MAVTLKDIAREVGVSHETVSRALNKRGRVGEATAKRVREAAERMGYTPNAMAKGLRSRVSLTVGVLFPCIYENEFYAGIYRGLEDALVDAGYFLFLCNSDFKPDRERAYLQALAGRRVDGIVIASAELRVDDYPNAEAIGSMLKRIPIVVVDREIPGVRADLVASDHFAGSRMAVEHLVELGHRRIGITVTTTVSSTMARLDAYRAVLAEQGIEPEPSWISHTDQPTRDVLFNAVQAMFKAPENQRPTALYATTENDIPVILQALESCNLRVPDDVSLVGFDGLRFGANLPVPLTTVAQDTRGVGQAAGQLLLQRFQGEGAAKPEVVAVPASLHTRSSTQALA